MEANLERPSYPTGTVVKLILGAFLVAIGILLTVENLSLFDATPFLRLWPLVLVAIGLVKVGTRCGPIFGVVLVVAGTWMTAYNLGWIHFTIFQLWPLILIGAGLAMMSRAFGWDPRTSMSLRDSRAAVFATREVVETSRDYTGTQVRALFGAWKLDLSRAEIVRSPAVIDVSAVFGGIEILVPDDWDVVGEVVPIMGGFELKGQAATGRTGGQLIIRGIAAFGGIEVKSVRRMS